MVTITRFLAYQDTDSQAIASILDQTDGIINLLLYGEEAPGELKQALEYLEAKYPDFAGLAAEYARPIAA